MFENIIGQQATVATLRKELAEARFPAAVLLHGPLYSGKLSTALEIARVLTCGQQGEWSCSCSSCRQQRLLVHPATLLAGSRYFEAEIAAAAESLRRVRKAAAQYLFIRAVRKLTRRFDPPLWEGEESRIRPLAGTLAQVEEALDALIPDGELEEKTLERRLEAIIAGCRQLARALPAENVPIHLIRRASAWLHLTATGESPRRVLILENAEGLLEASANSLLKLLEEPPTDTFLILTTVRRAALIPTVLSRLRPYAFADRSPAETAEVLTRIFREEAGEYPSLREYFLHWREVNPAELESLAQLFVGAILPGREERGETGPLLLKLAEVFAGRPGRDSVATFFEELTLRFGRLLRDGRVPPQRLERWNAVLRRHQEACARYNQQPLLTMESLLFSLRRVP